MVGRTGPRSSVRDEPPVSRPAQRHRLTAQLGRWRRVARHLVAASGRQLPPRHPRRGAAQHDPPGRTNDVVTPSGRAIMSTDEFIAANRRNWDERVPIHRRDRTGFYAMDRFLAGEKSLQAIVSGELGGVAGARLLHLQCHFGIDSLILAQHGPVVTGLDFSPAAIAEAKALDAPTGSAATTLSAHVYHPRDAITSDFDILRP